MEDDSRRGEPKPQLNREKLLEGAGLSAEALEEIELIIIEKVRARLKADIEEEIKRQTAQPRASRWTEAGVAAILAAALLEGALLLF